MAGSRRNLVVAVLAAVFGGCGALVLAGLAVLWVAGSAALRTPSSDGYWSQACVTSDEALLAAGGSSFAVLDLSSGAVVGRGDGYVHAVACEGPRAVVLAYSSTWTWPGGAQRPAVEAGGEELVLALADGRRLWTSRTSRSGRAAGPLVLSLDGGEQDLRRELGPKDFGEVGGAKSMPTPDWFRMWAARTARYAGRPGARLLVAAGWEPNRSLSWVEPVPWGFFELEPVSGQVRALLQPIQTDAALNLVGRPALDASDDGGVLALATSNGTDGTLAVFRPPATTPALRVPLPGWDEVLRLSVAPDGSRVAVASASRGDAQPARLLVIDAGDGRRLWSGEAGANVYGLALLGDGSLVWASGAREAARLELPGGRERWHARVP